MLNLPDKLQFASLNAAIPQKWLREFAVLGVFAKTREKKPCLFMLTLAVLLYLLIFKFCLAYNFASDKILNVSKNTWHSHKSGIFCWNTGDVPVDHSVCVCVCVHDVDGVMMVEEMK